MSLEAVLLTAWAGVCLAPVVWVVRLILDEIRYFSAAVDRRSPEP